jgi:hypothetical protein
MRIRSTSKGKIKRNSTVSFHSFTLCEYIQFYRYPHHLQYQLRNLFDEPKGRDLLIFLRVADKWQFDSQRQSALKRLYDRGSAAEKIATGREYEEAREWLIPAFMELCNREYPPDEEEGMLLGIKDLVLLWRIRFYMARVDYRSQDLSFEDYVKHVILHDGDPGAFPKRLSIPGSDHYGPLYGGGF